MVRAPGQGQVMTSSTDQALTRSGWRRLWFWVKRILLALLALLLLGLVIAAILEAIARNRAASDYPPPGKLVDVGGRKMHIDCRGSGSPTVVLEAGLSTGGSVDWTLVHDRIAAVTRTCSYDRAGVMWSEPKATPQHAATVAADLRATLAAAGIEGPIVLVGHSIGGPYVRTYAGLHGDQVAGLVLVDPSHPDQVARFKAGVGVDADPKSMLLPARIVSALSWTGAMRLIAGMEPLPNMPAEASAKVVAFSSGSVKGALSEIEGFNQTMDDARAVTSLGDRPLIVLTALKPMGEVQLKALGLTPEKGAAFQAVWQELNAEQARLSTRGRQILLRDASHYIQLDRPDAVIDAVKDVVDQVRADGAAKEQPAG